MRGTTLLNQDIRQHVFGDIIKESVVGEVRFKQPKHRLLIRILQHGIAGGLALAP